MAETPTYYKDTVLVHLGLTREDIVQRPVIAVGYVPEELLPDYRDQDHRRRAEEILRYLHSAPESQTLTTFSDSFDLDVSRMFPSKKLIEVVGGFAEACVPNAIGSIIAQDKYAYVDSSRVIGWKTRNDKGLNNKVRRETKFIFGGSLVNVGNGRVIYYCPKTNK